MSDSDAGPSFRNGVFATLSRAARIGGLWTAILRRVARRGPFSWRAALTRLRELEQPRLWLFALGVGVLAGYAAVLFIYALEFLHLTLYGATEDALASAAAELPWILVLIIPIVGGAIVGLLLQYGARDPVPLGVADVIEARALRGGQIEVRKGSISVLASALSLGFGASAGREGPAVLAGACVATGICGAMRLKAAETRTILGCAVAAAVSASFNAPIAGALFALEVVLGHYAVRAFAPITIASVAGAVVSRSHFGDTPAFALPLAEFGSYSQFPAFALLGLVSAIVAGMMMWSVFFIRDFFDTLRERVGAPPWSQPALAGVLLGLLAIAFPQTISVGYQTTTDALDGRIEFWMCVLLVCVKTAAVAITLGGRFAGGVFSPALMLGALTGAAFGSVAIEVFPSASGNLGLYALAGMGACAGAVLGAPISTTLIVFELTGDYDTAIAVMVSTSVATVATQQALNKSFFHAQLLRRGLDLRAGPQSFLLPTLQVRDYMRPRGAENAASDTASWELIEQNVYIRPDESLARVFPRFESGRFPYVPVVEEKTEGQGRTLIGAIFYVDALRAYNRSLVEMHEEEHS